MKTRVLKRFSTRNAVYIWIVEKWSLWDPPDLREAYPDEYDWRHVRSYPEEQPAKDAAKRIAEHGRDPCGVERYDGDNAEVVFECDNGVGTIFAKAVAAARQPVEATPTTPTAWTTPKYFFPVATLNQMQLIGEFFYRSSTRSEKMSIEVDGQDVIIRYADMDTEWLKALINDEG